MVMAARSLMITVGGGRILIDIIAMIVA